jgi:hypothetical protein
MLLRTQVKGKILGTVGKTKKGGFICNLLINGESDFPEILKIHSKNLDDFSPDDKGILTIPVQLQDFCFSDVPHED